jgi:hypothetical protein
MGSLRRELRAGLPRRSQNERRLLAIGQTVGSATIDCRKAETRLSLALMRNPLFRVPKANSDVRNRPTPGKSERKKFSQKISRNPLISLDSNEEIQGNPTLFSGGFSSERSRSKTIQSDSNEGRPPAVEAGERASSED